MIKVVITEDHPLMRQGLRNALEGQNGIFIADSCANGGQLMEALKQKTADVILLDLNLSDEGLQHTELVRVVKNKYPATKILILTSNDNAYNIQSVLHAGADGYILKSIEQHYLLEAIEQVHAGKQYLSPEVKDILLQLYRKDQGITTNSAMFTEREIEILQLITEEFSSPEIARKLNLSTRTIDTYRMGIMQKLGVKNMVGMAKKAIMLGIVKG